MEKAAQKDYAPENIGVKKIPTHRLLPNPHNPRMLFDKLPLDVLKNSIAKVGILVPLTVYWNKAKETYIILDGQRRWTCGFVIVFAHTCPNNSIPILHVSHTKWQGLFRRYD